MEEHFTKTTLSYNGERYEAKVIKSYTVGSYPDRSNHYMSLKVLDTYGLTLIAGLLIDIEGQYYVIEKVSGGDSPFTLIINVKEIHVY